MLFRGGYSVFGSKWIKRFLIFLITFLVGILSVRLYFGSLISPEGTLPCLAAVNDLTGTTVIEPSFVADPPSVAVEYKYTRFEEAWGLPAAVFEITNRNSKRIHIQVHGKQKVVYADYLSNNLTEVKLSAGSTISRAGLGPLESGQLIVPALIRDDSFVISIKYRFNRERAEHNAIGVVPGQVDAWGDKWTHK